MMISLFPEPQCPRRDITFQAVGTAKRRLLQILGGAACLRRRIEFAAALW